MREAAAAKGKMTALSDTEVSDLMQSREILTSI